MSSHPVGNILALKLENNYLAYNTLKYISPDPLEIVLDFTSPREGEIVGLVAALMAYGRASKIQEAVRFILHDMGSSPRDFIKGAGWRDEAWLSDFRYRFTTGEQLRALMKGLSVVLHKYGSLEAAAARHCGGSQTQGRPGYLEGLSSFCREIRGGADDPLKHLLPEPSSGVAKRIHMFMRWMVRSDEVDPGWWRDSFKPSVLMVPLDTHMFSLAKGLGLTRRKSADYRAMREITAGFAALNPQDPVKYDYSLTRLGIHPELSKDDFLKDNHR